MRVTNGMIVNTTLTGLYNNINQMNKTYAQMVTGKKIQTVSDDPIIAGRALKLKTSVLETTQYESNAKEAASWMEVTEAALTNMHKIIQTIRTKCVEASTGTLEKEDKEVIKQEIEELMKQLQEEANVSYGGRYVFSGYKTNEPLVLTSDTAMKQDTVLGAALQLAGEVTITADAKNPDNKTTALAGSTIAKGSILGAGVTLEAGETLGAGTVLSKEDAEAIFGAGFVSADSYTLSGDYTVAKDTKLSAESANELAGKLAPGSGMTTEEFKEKYFAQDEDGTVTVNEDMTIPEGEILDKAAAEEVLGVTVSADTYELAGDYELKAELSLQGSMTLGTDLTLKQGITLTEGTVLAKGTTLAEGSKVIKGTTLPSGTLNPNVSGKIEGQSIEYEIGANSTISVNTYNMDKIFTDLSKTINEISTMIDASLEDDTITTADLHKMLDGKLDEFDTILGNVSKANTDLGARMSRLEYVESRLTEEKTTLKSLLSDTEDVDIEEVYVKFNIQYSTYQSALQATSKIITNTLADYL